MLSLIARDSRIAREDATAAYFAQADPREVLRLVDEARPLNPDFGLDQLRARLQPERAREILWPALRREPANAELWLILAEIERRAGSEPAAKSAYLRARELAPRLPPYTPPRSP